MAIGEYNSSRPQIILKEYGRNEQKLVEYIRSILSIEKRTELSYTLIDLIRQLGRHASLSANGYELIASS